MITAPTASIAVIITPCTCTVIRVVVIAPVIVTPPVSASIAVIITPCACTVIRVVVIAPVIVVIIKP